MAGRKTDRRTKEHPSNWLAWLDRKAPTLTRATNWVADPFMLARYSNLRPQPISGSDRSRIACEIQEQIASRVFTEWESRIARTAETSVCLNGLNAEQRKQLAALLIQTITEIEMHAPEKRSSQWARCLRREAPARLHGLNRRLQKAQQAVEELQAYAQDSKADKTDNEAQHLARQLVGQIYGIVADKALKALTMKSLPKVGQFIGIADEHPIAKRVEAFGMVQLYWFFRHECDLTGDESEVRVARLRNAFWNEYDVSEVPYRKKSHVTESRGCGAVHTAVVNYRR
jgi:hypothetical protein